MACGPTTSLTCVAADVAVAALRWADTSAPRVSWLLLRQVHGAIYVVDSSDRARLEESKLELENVVKHPMVIGKPLLV